MQMDKLYRVANPQEPSTSTVSPERETDWEECFLCQERTSEVLKCPAGSKRSIDGAGYKTLADNLLGFKEINCLAYNISSRLKEGENMEETLRINKAKWHDSCRLQYNKTKLQRAIHKKTTSIESSDAPKPKKYCTRLSLTPNPEIAEQCFFCEQPAHPYESLHHASTFGLDARVRECALQLQDRNLLAKLSAGDLIALEAKYHTQCLVSLYNRARQAKHSIEQDDSCTLNQGIALAELVAYIEDIRADNEVAPIFKLADLIKMYSSRVEQLGTSLNGRVNSTHLKNRILAHFPDMQAQKDGRDILLVFNQDVGLAMKKACEHDSDADAIHLARAAGIVRKEIFSKKNCFTGSFESQCQESSVPSSLVALVSMILYGPNIKTQSSHLSKSQSALTLSQLLMFNSFKRVREGNSHILRHQQERETPLVQYIGVLIHSKTRKRQLVDALFELGLCISYDRLMSISTLLGNNLCRQFEMEKVVCPPKLKKNLLTVAAIDNVDHNPSSTTAQQSFHGTSISLSQNPQSETSEVERITISLHANTHSVLKKSLDNLPQFYTDVPPVTLSKKYPVPPKFEGPNKSSCLLIPEAMQAEYRWLNYVRQEIKVDHLSEDKNLSWAAYHASCNPIDKSRHHTKSLSCLLPLFYEDSKSVAMLRHGMDVVKNTVDALNPDQVPIITADQPLYTLCKQIQWRWPEIYGENHFIVMFGGLHIEMNAFKLLGDLLENSGWTGALTHANIASSGTADSYLKVSHLTRTRHAHQVTASSLYALLHEAYSEYCKCNQDSPTSLEAWCDEKAMASPQFHFWFTILQLQLQVLIFVRSLREANFKLYIDSLSQLVPWLFALDHTHYARWIPVHLRDMITLAEKHPSIYEEFLHGNFTVNKTGRTFSNIAIDQAHEQHNASVKGDGGSVGLTQDPEALRRWMVSGPEMARLIEEFQASMEKAEKKSDHRHHEQTRGMQVTFFNQVKVLCNVITEMGNPFMEESNDLLVLDTRDIVDPLVISALYSLKKTGQEQYDLYVTERLVNQTKPITDPIKRNNLALFSRQPVQKKSRMKHQLSSLKSDCSLFSSLYISCQTRDGDLDKFFAHENQACPPSLSNMGKLRLGTKSDIVSCLEKLSSSGDSTSSNRPHFSLDASDRPTVDVMVLDGAAIVNMLKPGTARTFSDYASQIFLPYVKTQLQNVQRVDVVWDEYVPDSLKAYTRSMRGKGCRRRVESSNVLPRNWNEFLRNDDNKVELFSFLSQKLAKVETETQVIITHHKDILCTQQRNATGLAPCTQEEADTRIFLHVMDAANHGYGKVMVRTVDSDVLVLAVAAFQQLNINELWIAFATGKSFRNLPAHKIANVLGPEKCMALPFLHAFSGCDTVSSFAGRGKTSVWETWKVCDEVTSAMCTLASTPESSLVDDQMVLLERFVVLLYDRTSTELKVNEARKQLFAHKGRSMDGLPPTRAALLEHTKRAAYQAGHVWKQMFVAVPDLPSPSEWGWLQTTSGGGWEVKWTALPEASQACRELLKCGCKKGCRRQCKCVKANLQCTALCLCKGLCDRD